MSTVDPTTSRTATLREIREGERFLLVTHEHPDGDALGSLVAMHEILVALGKDSVMFVAADEFPLPYEYRFFVFDGLVSQAPPDVDQRTVIFLDCGNIDRNPLDAVKGDHVRIVNIDHHHDNTRFGTVDHVVEEASCTAEIVWDLMRELGVTATSTIADALYVGLVTDTGKFMYENTGTRAHLMAAELIAAGVDVNAVYRRLYEEMPYSKLELLALGLANLRRYDDGRLTFTILHREDFHKADAEESYSEGLIDHLRSVRGTKVAAVARELLADNGDGPHVRRKKLSLRATDGEVDVSAIARAGGGGGHRQAAGFTTRMSDDELIAFLRDQVALQLGGGSSPGGPDSPGSSSPAARNVPLAE
ncbi:MAG: phosphoesterase RecJ domain protein [Solirubrobacterales bacterium]|nr:phosphoesterase RecJ domain protein [Solirubrobacterales bacterium]